MRCTLDPLDKDKVKEVFSELEFRTLAKQVLGDEAGQLQTTSAPTDLFGGAQEVDGETPAELVDLRTIDSVPHKYQLVNTSEGMYMLVAQLKKQKAFCFDTETTGLDQRRSELVGMAFSWKEHTGHYVVVPEDQEEAKKVVAIFKEVLEDESKVKVAQNLKYDMLVMRHYGVEVEGELFDTMLAHYLLQPELKHNMDYLSETYLKYRPVSIETLIGPKNKPLRTMREADVNAVKEYSAEDADVTWQLKELFAPATEEGQIGELFTGGENAPGVGAGGNGVGGHPHRRTGPEHLQQGIERRPDHARREDHRAQRHPLQHRLTQATWRDPLRKTEDQREREEDPDGPVQPPARTSFRP
jgi:DNA polymerase-1